jgi:ketosteroid isomerase-like protein
MRKLIPALMGMACGAVLTGLWGRRRSGDRERRLAEIEEFHRVDRTAAMAKDIHTLHRLWTEDCVLLPPGRPPVIGQKALWEYIQEQGEEMAGVEILEYDQDFQEVTILGDWAFEWALFTGAARPAGEEIQTSRAKLFRVLRRQPDGTWKCARSIWSDEPEDGGPGGGDDSDIEDK